MHETTLVVRFRQLQDYSSGGDSTVRTCVCNPAAVEADEELHARILLGSAIDSFDTTTPVIGIYIHTQFREPQDYSCGGVS